MTVATGFYQLKRTINAAHAPSTIPWISNLDVADPYLHRRLQGIVESAANDASYMDNAYVSSGSPIVQAWFQLAKLPSTLTVLKIYYRWRTSASGGGQGTTIDFFQGHPSFGNGIASQIAFGTGVVQTSFITSTAIVSILDITNTSDVWIQVGSFNTPSGFPVTEFDRISWLAFEATFAYGAGETPTSKSYAIGMAPMSTPVVTVIGTPGSTTWGYRVVPENADGQKGEASDEIFVEDGNAVLDSDNFNCITWTDVDGAVSYTVYRTTAGGTPSETGEVFEIASGEGACGNTGTPGDNDDDGDDVGDEFDPALCQGVTTVTYPTKESPILAGQG